MFSLKHIMPAAAILGMGIASHAATAALTPTKDNSVYSESTTFSNGAGPGIYAGRAGTTASGGTRRGLVAFNVAASVPAGSTVTNATLQLYCIKTVVGDEVVSLHKLLSNWGEGTSSGTGAGAAAATNDATWISSMHPSTSWTTAGGDFTATATASQTVGAQSLFYTWASNAQMIADVQSWVNAPATNFGWLIKGNEASFPTAKEFGSKEIGAPVSGPDLRPILTITYTPPSGVADWSVY